jgi:hypothetical protein
MPEAVWEALRALDERKASHDLLPRLLAAKEELAEFLFRCPVPKRGRVSSSIDYNHDMQASHLGGACRGVEAYVCALVKSPRVMSLLIPVM